MIHVADKIKVYNADCMDIMRKYPDKYFDLAVVDPPYGINLVWAKSRYDQFYKHRSGYKNDITVNREYIDELQRVSREQIIFGWNYFCHLLPETNNLIIWDKQRDASKTFMSEAELAWTSFRKPIRIYRQQWDGFKKGPDTGIKKIHPFQKPVNLYLWILKNYATPFQKILDTHLGSGSSAIAAYNFGSSEFVGIELEEEYYKGFLRRFEEETAQMELL